ncbi:sialin-like [Haliotis asinina]|uniref:sialin-like n=1 Tax=Haliotis asinina TaxID=109174 RepID=UPI0035318552
MESEHQPIATDSPSSELYDERAAIKPAFHHEYSESGGGGTNRRDTSGWMGFSVPKRYVLAFMAFLGFGNVYALRVNLSVAIVAMTKNRTVLLNGNVTVVSPPDFDWDNNLQGVVLSSFFYGYILTQLPGGYLATRFGGKYMFGGGIFVTALLTILTPVFATWSVYLLIAARVIEGLFEGVTYPAIHAMWSKWAPPQEKTKLATFAFSGAYLGTVLAMPACGSLAASSGGWQSIFYVFGSVGILWFLFWCIFISESPAKHPTISNFELEYIQQAIGYTDEQTKRIHPPWLSMLTSLPVWAIVVAHFAENWGFYTWLTELPTFLNSVLHFKLDQGGFLAALPYLVMGLVVLTSGHLADIMRGPLGVSTGIVRRIFTCGAFAIQAVFMIAAGYLMTPVAGMTCLTIAVGLGGFAWSGFSVNHLDIAPQYASILMGLSNTFATIPGIISPSLTSAIVTSKGNAGQWQIIFYLAAAVYGCGAIMYGILAGGERQKWAEIPLGYQPHLDDPEKDQ